MKMNKTKILLGASIISGVILGGIILLNLKEIKDEIAYYKLYRKMYYE